MLVDFGHHEMVNVIVYLITFKKTFSKVSLNYYTGSSTYIFFSLHRPFLFHLSSGLAPQYLQLYIIYLFMSQIDIIDIQSFKDSVYTGLTSNLLYDMLQKVSAVTYYIKI